MTRLNEVTTLTPLALSGPDLRDAATALVVALGCGLLIGIERERRKGSGPQRAFAGLRTFALTCVMGAAAALSGLPGVVLVGAAVVGALAVVAYWRDRSDDPGSTTEVALLLTYLIGVLCSRSLPLAAALAVGLTALLAGRAVLHQWASQWLRPGEVRDGIVLAALVLIALPLVPDRPLWGPVLNPYLIVQLLALLLGVQSLAHLCGRLLQARHAVAFSALASGFVSSTATIATLGLAVREGRSAARLMAGGGLLSCVSTQLQLLLVAAAVQPAWLALLWGPAVASGLLATAWGGWLVWSAPLPADGPAAPGAGAGGLLATSPQTEGLPAAQDDRMFSLRGAALVAALLSGIQIVVYALQLWLGQAGLLVGVLLAALADLHAALAAVFALAGPAGPAGMAAVLPVMLALLVHAGSKSVVALFSGGGRYLAWLAPGLWVHTLLGVAGLWWLAS